MTRTLDDLPSPDGLPLLGHALQLRPRQLHLILESWSHAFGSPFAISIGAKKILVCSDPAWLQTALRERPERYRRFSPIESVIAEMGWNGVFSVEGEAWRPQRRLVVQALAASNMRAFFPTLQAITDRLRRRWQRAAQAGEVVQMTDDLARYTVDVTTALAFGEDPNTIEETGDAIQAHLSQVFPMVNARINAPFPYWRYLKLPQDRRLEHALRAIDTHIAGLIDRARARLHASPAPPASNLLEAMLLAANMPGAVIDDKVIAANVKTLLLAGEDTTAQTLAWTLSFLGSDRTMQARLQDAAAQALGTSMVCPDFDGLKKLDLFESAAYEAMRLRPIVPIFFLESTTDVTLGDVAVPAGTPLFFLLRPAMQGDQHFAEPDTYIPERFMAGDGPRGTHDGRAFVQFGAGPRVCPGRQLAGIELRLVLSMLARNFTAELTIDPASIQETMSFTMMPSEGPVRLSPIGHGGAPAEAIRTSPPSRRASAR